MKKIKAKVVRWIQANERNFNIFYRGIFLLSVLIAFATPTLPFMNDYVQFTAIILIGMILAIYCGRKYYNKEWSSED